jgi:two-component system response regulator AtoC
MHEKTILLVDDEANMRRVMTIMLQRLNYEVIQAIDGEQALSMLKQEGVDLIITDLRMPKIDGLALLQQLQLQNTDIPVIMVTAHGSVESAVSAMKHGAFDFIIRPFDIDAIEMTIKRALNVGKVQQENRYLRTEIEKGWGEFIGQSAAMHRVYALIKQVAPAKTSIMITGETGTGKEVVARAIHRSSTRSDGLFVPINCAAIPVDILESELFGYSKGAFTGANKDRMGKFETANDGTLFLDEITEMPLNLQAKLLRVLQENTLERLGSNRTISLNIRIIAATNRDPRQAIVDEKLREDLFYRLNVITIDLPPLRERKEDIQSLVNHFLNKHATSMGYRLVDIDPLAINALESYYWPGNVRELENMMERAVVLSNGQTIQVEHLPLELLETTDFIEDSGSEEIEYGSLALQPKVEQLEKQLIIAALEKTQGNKSKASRILEISERSLWYKLKKYVMT